MKNNDYKYFYIIGVRSIRNKMDTKLSLDFMIEYNDIDVKNCKIAKFMTSNQLLKTTIKDAIESNQLLQLQHELHIAKLRSNANNLTTHKFKTTIQWLRGDFEKLVELSNISNEIKNQLEESMIYL